MKRHMPIAGFIALLLLSAAAYAADTTQVKDGMEGKSVDMMLSEIRSEQGIGSSDRIDPNKVSDSLLEQLGDAWMDVQFPDQREHELMDDMMGGEGSASLASMHRMMGYRYLSGGRGGMGMGGMMGPGMGPGMMMGYGTDPDPSGPGTRYRVPDPGYRGHGYGAYRTGVWWIWIVVLIIIIGSTIVVTILLTTSLFRRYPKHLHGVSHMDILRTRYARGEITKKEYEEKKKDLS